MKTRTRTLGIRLTEDDDELLADAEKIFGQKRSEAVRQAIWGYWLPIIKRRKEGERGLLDVKE